MGDYNRVKQKLWKKKILVGKTKPTSYDTKPHNIYLEAEIKEKANQRNFKDLKEMKKFKTFSISGHSRDFAGQINDKLTDKNVNFTIPKARVQKIKKLWKQWHLNDFKAGTMKQEEAIGKMKGKYDYDKVVKHLKKKKLYTQKGYKYGYGWLANPLPQDVEKEIMKTFDM